MKRRLWMIRKRFWEKIADYAAHKAHRKYLVCPYPDQNGKPFDFS